jgi:hypothetical protein
MLVDALQNKKKPPERVMTAPVSIPALDALTRRKP